MKIGKNSDTPLPMQSTTTPASARKGAKEPATVQDNVTTDARITKVKDLLDLKCSFFNNTFSKPVGEVKVRSLFDGSLKKSKLVTYKWTEVELNCTTSEQLDTYLADHVKRIGKDSDYLKKKEYQVAITPSGVFGERRTYEYLIETHPLVIIDLDDTKRPLDSFKKFPWVVGAGQSSSRLGIFVLVYINNPALLKEHFLALKKIFDDADDLKDTTRLRYLSYGKSWVRGDNEEIQPFMDTVAVQTDEVYEVKQLKKTTENDTKEIVEAMLSQIGSIEEAGGFHPWTARIAARCNKKGITLGYAMRTIWDLIKDAPVIKDTPRYTEDRFKHDFKSIYELYKDQHHIEIKVRISRAKVSRFNSSIYAKSPKILQDLVATVEQDEEKEVVYFTGIILLGLLFPNRVFKYFNNLYYPNLYGYILGDAASFKGKAKIIRQALKPYQQKIDDLYKSKTEAKAETMRFNKENKEVKKVVDKVPDLNFFFDGNTSSAAMLKAMQDSPVLCMFETEGDTITKTWKTDWGNYSDILRKAFEHEPLYSLKKNGNEENLLRIHIQNPKLSVLVSSTEQQMRKVLSADETENGLMSRFLFYVVQNDKKWYNGWESNTDTDLGKILTDRLKPDIWWSFTTQNDVHYYLSKEAYQLHQEYFNHVNDSWPDELFNIISLIRRAGTATARIAMMLEELKYFDKPKKTLSVRSYTVSGTTMALAVDIMKILLQHLFIAWQITYKEKDERETNVQTVDLRQKIAELLTAGRGSQSIAKELGMSRSTVKHHITKIKEDETD